MIIHKRAASQRFQTSATVPARFRRCLSRSMWAAHLGRRLPRPNLPVKNGLAGASRQRFMPVLQNAAPHSSLLFSFVLAFFPISLIFFSGMVSSLASISQTPLDLSASLDSCLTTTRFRSCRRTIAAGGDETSGCRAVQATTAK